MSSVTEKRAELAQLQQMNELSEDLVQFLSDISERFESLAQGSSAVADTMCHWADIFQLMSVHEQAKAKDQALVLAECDMETSS